jgi:hypothetical protein
VPALLGASLLLANYGKLKGQRYGIVLTEYPRARYLHDVAELRPLLESEQVCDAQKTRLWIATNAGPLPAEEMPERVARQVLDLIAHKAKVG